MSGEARGRLATCALLFELHGFYRVHDKWCVSVERIREVRLQRDGVDWEVVIQPPVNRVIR
jgi:DNA-binding LytR/AlgR family response regulator